MNLPDFEEEKKLWKRGFKFVAGADEVGRGAFAGPVVAGAVVFDKNAKFQMMNYSEVNCGVSLRASSSVNHSSPQQVFDPEGSDRRAARYSGSRINAKNGVKINDSKKLNKIQREKVEEWIKNNCLAYGIGEAPVSFINKHGIVRATRRAFRRALKNCNAYLGTQGLALRACDFLLVDAFYLPYTRGLKRKYQKAIIKGDSKSVSVAAASIIAKVYRDKLMADLSKKHKEYGWERNKGYGTKEHQEAIRKHGLTWYHRKGFVKNVITRNEATR